MALLGLIIKFGRLLLNSLSSTCICQASPWPAFQHLQLDVAFRCCLARKLFLDLNCLHHMSCTPFKKSKSCAKFQTSACVHLSSCLSNHARHLLRHLQCYKLFCASAYWISRAFRLDIQTFCCGSIFRLLLWSFLGTECLMLVHCKEGLRVCCPRICSPIKSSLDFTFASSNFQRRLELLRLGYFELLWKIGLTCLTFEGILGRIVSMEDFCLSNRALHPSSEWVVRGFQ